MRYKIDLGNYFLISVLTMGLTILFIQLYESENFTAILTLISFPLIFSALSNIKESKKQISLFVFSSVLMIISFILLYLGPKIFLIYFGIDNSHIGYLYSLFVVGAFFFSSGILQIGDFHSEEMKQSLKEVLFK
jgi:hypothetical protein